MNQKITVEVLVHAPIETVWEYWTEPAHITRWNAASDDWHAPHATNDLRVGGAFSCRMEAKDGSAGFDFNGTYTKVVAKEHIEYVMEGGRKVTVTFEQTDGGTRVAETFETENENPVEMQRAGWQAILENFRNYTESR